MGRVLAALQEVTGVCRACHDTFRVVVIDPDDADAR
jgi:cytochrome c556